MSTASWALAAAYLGAAIAIQTYSIEQAHERDQKLHIQLAVSELPFGTSVAWEAYVDQRIAATFKAGGLLVRVIDFNTGKDNGEMTFVSSNSPYTLKCDSFGGAIVEFAHRDNPVLVPIYGWGFIIDPDEPPLGVDRQSIAAKELYMQLCEKTARNIQAIFLGPQLTQYNVPAPEDRPERGDPKYAR